MKQIVMALILVILVSCKTTKEYTGFINLRNEKVIAWIMPCYYATIYPHDTVVIAFRGHIYNRDLVISTLKGRVLQQGNLDSVNYIK